MVQEAGLLERSSFPRRGPRASATFLLRRAGAVGAGKGQCPPAWVLVSTQPSQLGEGQAVVYPALACAEQL